MLLLNNVTTSDSYGPAATLGPVPTTEKIVYVVANQPVLCQVASWQPNKVEGTWSDEILVTPQTAEFQRVTGVRFRSALPGRPAQVIAQLIEPGDPIPVGGTPFTAALAASGGLTPGNVSMQFQKDGTLVATEPILDVLTGLGVAVAMADDPANSRVTLKLSSGLTPLGKAFVNPAAGSITFSAISQLYDHLLLVAGFGNDTAADQAAYMRFNGDSANHYRYQEVIGGGTAASGIYDGGALVNAAFLGNCPGAPLGWYTPVLALIPNYGFGSARTYVFMSGHVGASFAAGAGGGLWTQAGPITSLTLVPGAGNWSVGSAAELYGVAGP